MYLKDKAVAERYEVSRSCIWAWCAKGTFPLPIHLGEKCTRWRLEDLEKWEKEKEGKTQ